MKSNKSLLIALIIGLFLGGLVTYFVTSEQPQAEEAPIIETHKEVEDSEQEVPESDSTLEPVQEVFTEVDTSPKSGELGNPFSYEDLYPGYLVGGMEIVNIRRASYSSEDQKWEYSKHNYAVDFEGATTVEGEYRVYAQDDGLLGGSVCFTATDKAMLPYEQIDQRKPWFCFSNPEFARSSFLGTEGQATITIDNYTLNYFEGEAINFAELVSIQ